MECTTVSVITTITTAATITTTTTTMSVTDVYSDVSNTQTSIDPFCPLGNNQGFLLIRGVDRGGVRLWRSWVLLGAGFEGGGRR